MTSDCCVCPRAIKERLPVGNPPNTLHMSLKLETVEHAHMILVQSYLYCNAETRHGATRITSHHKKKLMLPGGTTLPSWWTQLGTSLCDIAQHYAVCVHHCHTSPPLMDSVTSVTKAWLSVCG